jgi:hypothetical protein
MVTTLMPSPCKQQHQASKQSATAELVQKDARCCSSWSVQDLAKTADHHIDAVTLQTRASSKGTVGNGTAHHIAAATHLTSISCNTTTDAAAAAASSSLPEVTPYSQSHLPCPHQQHRWNHTACNTEAS